MNRKQKFVLGSAVALIVVLFVMIIGGRNGLFDLSRLKKEKAGIVEANATIEEENVKLYRSIKRLKHDPRFVENVARQELGMVGKNELIFKFKKDTPGHE